MYTPQVKWMRRSHSSSSVACILDKSPVLVFEMKWAFLKKTFKNIALPYPERKRYNHNQCISTVLVWSLISVGGVCTNSGSWFNKFASVCRCKRFSSLAPRLLNWITISFLGGNRGRPIWYVLVTSLPSSYRKVDSSFRWNRSRLSRIYMKGRTFSCGMGYVHVVET